MGDLSTEWELLRKLQGASLFPVKRGENGNSSVVPVRILACCTDLRVTLRARAVQQLPVQRLRSQELAVWRN